MARYIVNVIDVDDTLGFPSPFHQLKGSSEEQLTEVKTEVFLKKLAELAIAPWVLTNRRILDEADENIVVSGRHDFMKEVTETWLNKVVKLPRISMVKYLCFSDYEKYLKDKKSSIGAVVLGLQSLFEGINVVAGMIRRVYNEGYRVNVFDDNKDTIRWVQSLGPTRLITPYLVNEGQLVPRNLFSIILAH
jgi:hypothetical protein